MRGKQDVEAAALIYPCRHPRWRSIQVATTPPSLRPLILVAADAARPADGPLTLTER
ncbi:MAG: hypothetical protein ACHQAY_06780 [Hyphomicrobiales bacterium]